MTFPVEIMTSAEIRALINACSNRAPTGVRIRALIAILYRCGLRIGETLALMSKDLDEKAGSIPPTAPPRRWRRTLGQLVVGELAGCSGG